MTTETVSPSKKITAHNFQRTWLPKNPQLIENRVNKIRKHAASDPLSDSTRSLASL